MPAETKAQEEALFEMFETTGWQTLIVPEAVEERSKLLESVAYGANSDKELFYYKGVLSVLDRIINMETVLRTQAELDDE